MENRARTAFDFDSEKAALVKKSNSLERNLSVELEQVKEYLQDYGKNIAIIGGSLLATYLVVKLISGNEKENNNKTLNQPQFIQPQSLVHVVNEPKENAVVKQIKNSIALFLMSVAKRKLTEFLDQKMLKGE